MKYERKRYIAFSFEKSINVNDLKKQFSKVYVSLYGILNYNLYSIKLFIKYGVIFVSSPVSSLYESLVAFTIAYYNLTGKFPCFKGIYPTVKSAARKLGAVEES